MKISRGYKLLFRWVLFLHRQYYRKIEVEGKENIPEGRVIFAPNHQNAIMDALAVLCTVEKPIFFLARGDFFKNRWLSAIFRFLKIYPAYRKVEGYQQLAHNYATLAKARRWLLSGNAVCIFPEGGHEGSWRLRSLSKGLFRLALETQAEIPREPVYVVPVSIFYSSYTKWGGNLYLKFGKPINVLSAYKTWKVNKAQGVNQLKNLVYEAMQNIVLQANEKYYAFIVNIVPFAAAYYGRVDDYTFVRKFVNHCNKLSISNPILMDRASEQFFALCKQGIPVSANCLWKKAISVKHFYAVTLLRLCMAPFVALLLLYLIPFLAFTKLVNHFIADRQFHSSVRYVLLSFLPVWHGIAFFALWYLTQQALIAGIVVTFFAFLSLKGYLAVDFFANWMNEWKCYRYRQKVEWLQTEIEKILRLLNDTVPYVAEHQSRENFVSRY